MAESEFDGLLEDGPAASSELEPVEVPAVRPRVGRPVWENPVPPGERPSLAELRAAGARSAWFVPPSPEGRAAAVGRGRALGVHEAARRGEVGVVAAQRVARAMVYAAWEADGKPDGQMGALRAEFGVTSSPEVTDVADRAAYMGSVKEKTERKGGFRR